MANNGRVTAGKLRDEINWLKAVLSKRDATGISDVLDQLEPSTEIILLAQQDEKSCAGCPDPFCQR